MTVKVSVMSRYCIVQLLMLTVVRGERHVVDWSIDGVRNYTGRPLEVRLSDSLPEPDQLVLRCVPGSYSNMIWQDTQLQFDNCNATLAPSMEEPLHRNVGECYGGSRDQIFEVTRNSGSLSNALDFEVGRTLYFTSYSDGTSITSALNNVTVGGECEDGLKLAVTVIDPAATTESTTPSPPTTTQSPSQSPSQPLSQATSQSSSTSAGSTDSASTGASTDPGTFLPSLPPVSLGVNSASTLQTLLATTATALVCTAVALVMK